ncbi:MAG: dihydrofolate reductase [Patescibacteria group bacterium]
MKHPVYLIVAADKNLGIGKDGKLPWHLKKEMQFFKKMTLETQDPQKQNMVLMGRTTWESIPEKFRPLPGRINIVLTHQSDYNAPGADIFDSLDKALSSADSNIEKIFIIGGAQVFKEALNNPHLTGIYLTKIDKTFDCDTFLPDLPKNFSEEVLDADSEAGITFKYFYYSKK